MDLDLDLFRQWVDKRVVAVVNSPDGEAVEIDGELKMVHEKGIMIRPRGRAGFEMLSSQDLEGVELYEYKAKKIEPKRMAHVPFGSIRQHLADRHGWALEELNAKGYGENEAYDTHEKEHAPMSDAISHFHEG